MNGAFAPWYSFTVCANISVDELKAEPYRRHIVFLFVMLPCNCASTRDFFVFVCFFQANNAQQLKEMLDGRSEDLRGVRGLLAAAEQKNHVWTHNYKETLQTKRRAELIVLLIVLVLLGCFCIRVRVSKNRCSITITIGTAVQSRNSALSAWI